MEMDRVGWEWTGQAWDGCDVAGWDRIGGAERR